MARYEFKIDIPIYLPPEAIEEFKLDMSDFMRTLAAKCGEYQVQVQMQMKRTPEPKEAEEEDRELEES